MQPVAHIRGPWKGVIILVLGPVRYRQTRNRERYTLKLQVLVAEWGEWISIVNHMVGCHNHGPS